MVHPPPSVTQNGRPVVVVQRSTAEGLKYRNPDEFARHLRRNPLMEERPFRAVPEAGRDEGSPARIHSEMSPSDPLDSASTSLAPEEGLQVGRGAADLGELFALFNPAGVESVPQVVVPAALPPAAVAEAAQLIERWVRRFAWGGDQRRGVARLDIGGGRFAGAELLVTAEAGKVSVELSLPSNVSDPLLSDRLRARLEQRGYAAEVVVR